MVLPLYRPGKGPEPPGGPAAQAEQAKPRPRRRSASPPSRRSPAAPARLPRLLGTDTTVIDANQVIWDFVSRFRRH
jgi:poly(3-hydroxybutyrate) depolymerase